MKTDVVFKFEPQTSWQVKAWNLWQNPKTRVLVILGAAGSGKTHVSMGCALHDQLPHKNPKVYLTRPLVQACGEDLGYLPGNVGDKMEPYLAPFKQVLGRLVYGVLPKNILEPVALAHLRGWNLTDCVGLLDEAQNCTRRQLLMYLSRLGKNGRLIITGDPYQSDIVPTVDEDYDTDLQWVADRLEDSKIPGVHVIDVPEKEAGLVRDPLVQRFVKALG